MKRRTTRLALYLLAGAFINIAIAWTIAYFDPEVVIEGTFALAITDVDEFGWPSEIWTVTQEHAPGTTFVTSAVAGPFMHRSNDETERHPSELLPNWTKLNRPGKSHPIETACARGWPMRAMCSSVRMTGYPDPAAETEVSLDSLVVWLNNTDVVIPLRPIPLGFTTNTLFHAISLWLIIFIPKTLRTNWHKARNRCTTCTYDLRGAPPNSSTCPECGAPTRLQPPPAVP